MGPALLVAGAGRSVGQAAMGHAQQRPARLLVDQVDLDQARPRRHRFAAVPAEAVGEAMDRNDLREPPAGDVLAGDVDEVKPTGMRLQRRFRAHPPQNLFRIGEESEDGRWRRRDLDLTPDHERFNHREPPSARARRDAPSRPRVRNGRARHPLPRQRRQAGSVWRRAWPLSVKANSYLPYLRRYFGDNTVVTGALRSRMIAACGCPPPSPGSSTRPAPRPALTTSWPRSARS